MFQVGLLIQAGSVCRDDFCPGITRTKPAQFAEILACVLKATKTTLQLHNNQIRPVCPDPGITIRLSAN